MLQQRLNREAAGLTDEQLTRAIASAERCALCLTRTRREVALMRLRCLRCELDRRSVDALAATPDREFLAN